MIGRAFSGQYFFFVSLLVLFYTKNFVPDNFWKIARKMKLLIKGRVIKLKISTILCSFDNVKWRLDAEMFFQLGFE